jgi:hypothetical protein
MKNGRKCLPPRLSHPQGRDLHFLQYEIEIERRQLGRAGDSLVIRQGDDVVAISTEQARRLVQAIVEACR